MADKEAGRRLAAVLRIGMAAAGLNSYHALAARTAELDPEGRPSRGGATYGVSASSIENWVGGVATPQAPSFVRLARALEPHVTRRDLEAAWFDLPPEEPPLVDVLSKIAPDLHELVVLLRAQANQAVLEGVRDALEEARLGRAQPRRGRPSEPGDEIVE